MKTRLWFWKIDSIGEGSEVSILTFGKAAMPDRIVECASIAEVVAAQQTYAQEIEALGLCGRLNVDKARTETGRALSGLKKVPNILINKHIGEAAHVAENA